MPRTYVNRILLTTLYRDLCSATEEHPVAQVDMAPHLVAKLSNDATRSGDSHRQLCFFHSDCYVGVKNGFSIFRMPPGTKHEGWELAVPINRADRMSFGPTKALNSGYVVRYPMNHYAYPIIRDGEQQVIETDEIQSELLFGLYLEWLPADSVAHWVRVGKGHMIRVKLHGLHSRKKRQTISGRIVMRDFWTDQYFGHDCIDPSNPKRTGRVFLDDFHASTICRIVKIMDSMLLDLATDGTPKAMARAMESDRDEFYGCQCGYYGPNSPVCTFKYEGVRRHPVFLVTCPECGRDCTPKWMIDMNRSIKKFAIESTGSTLGPFSVESPPSHVLRPLGAKVLSPLD